MGQILSMRPDVLAPEYQAEFAKQLDDAPPVPVEQIKAVIQLQLGKPLAELFKSFDDHRLAAASIGQVHAAVLPDGTEVAVEVRRPGEVELVETDLEIMASLAHRATQHWEWARRYDVESLVKEFVETMRREMDYS